jgi:hypothetical protein
MSALTPKKLVGSRVVRARYNNIVGRTVSRWVKKGILPRPDQWINNRPYWFEDTLEQHERARVAAGNTTTPTPTTDTTNITGAAGA